MNKPVNNQPQFFTDVISNLVSRRNYSKIRTKFTPPSFMGAQSESYKKFLESDLERIIKNFFPIISNSGSLELHFEKLIFKKPEISEFEAWEHSATYQSSVYAQLKLVNNETGEVTTVKPGRDGEGAIFLGYIPLLTQKGTFIVNGIEKFVISQIVRSPGAYFLNKFQLKLSNSRKKIQEGNVCELLPLRGLFLLFNKSEHDDPIKVLARTLNGDNAVQFYATTLLKALGLGHNQILEIFDHSDYITATLENEKYNHNIIWEEETLELLEIMKMSSDHNELLSENKNLLDEELLELLKQFYDKCGEQFFKLKTDLLEQKQDSDEYGLIAHKINKLLQNNADLIERIASERAAQEIVNQLNISQKVSKNFHSYRELLWHYLFEKRMYDMGAVGRYKLNRKLRISERLYDQVLAQDIYDVDGNLIFAKNTLMLKKEIQEYKRLVVANRLNIHVKVKLNSVPKNFKNKAFLKDMLIEKVKIYDDKEKQSGTYSLIGLLENPNHESLKFADLLSVISYLAHLSDGVGNFDYIDHLGNKRLRLISELLGNRIQVALSRIEKFVREKMANSEIKMKHISLKNEPQSERITIKSLINTKPFQMIIKEFFNSHQLTQFIDQQNPLSELTNKRRISAMGPGGASREDPNLDLRDVHYSHYGRICPIETPEGMNIGLIMSLASYSQIDKHGFIVSPYFKVVDGKPTDQVEWLTALREYDYMITESMSPRNPDGTLKSPVEVRFNSQIEKFDAKEVDYIDVSPQQVVSIATASIPFLENDDANRALMGANMQRQATPLLKPYAPLVGTGFEYKIAKESGMTIVAEKPGTVVAVDGDSITVKYDDSAVNKKLNLVKFKRSNQDTCNNQTPIVKPNQKIQADEVLADGPAMQNGELALGQNVLVAFTTWSGYNYEDAIIISSRLFHEDIYTSVHFDEYTVECLRTKNGDEEITRQIPNVSEDAKTYLNEEGVIMVGAKVREGDILVGKTSPKAQVEQTAEERLLQAIFSEKKAKQVRDSSLKVPHGGEGVVAAVKRFSIQNGDDLNDDVIEIIKVFVAQKRKIQLGDKMAGRHGNKGIVSKIMPIEDMPHLSDGTPIDIMLNPLGVPSRMNIGQVLEIHLGLAAFKLGLKQLITFYFQKTDTLIIGQTFGLTADQVVMLIKHLDLFVKEKGIITVDQAIKEIGEIELAVILNRAGLTREQLGFKVCTPVFSGVNHDDLVKIMQEAGIDPLINKGKFDLYDGRTGEKFEKPISVGVMYMLKLDHMVDDKIHARSVGSYSKITQQPLGGKSQNGGQRFGEMEVWALEAYGAAYNLQELLTIKSDDLYARNAMYSAIIKNKKLPQPGLPESFKILIKKLEGLCFKINVSYGDNQELINSNRFIEDQSSDLQAIAVHESDQYQSELSDQINEIVDADRQELIGPDSDFSFNDKDDLIEQ